MKWSLKSLVFSNRFEIIRPGGIRVHIKVNKIKMEKFQKFIVLRKISKIHSTQYNCRTVRRSFSQLAEVEPKHCAVKMGITCQNFTNYRISQNRDIGL